MNDAREKPHPKNVSAPATTRSSVIPWPPVIYMLAIAASLGLHALFPLPWLGSPMSDILVAVGWLALLAAAALFITSIRALYAARTPINPNIPPEHLITSGPFGISRNPIYLTDTLLMLGIALVTGIVWFLPAAILAASITRKVAIDKEERWLMEKFGKRYRDYSKRVRRWI